MTIDELIKAKQVLELEITTAVYQLIDGFKEQTGISPHSVDIRLIDMTTIGDKRRHFSVCDARIELEIDLLR